MKFGRVAVTSVVLLVCVALAGTWVKAADSHDADSAAIKKLFNDFNDAFNGHDAHAAAVLFTNDADYTTVAGATSVGPDGIEKHLVPLFAGRLKTIHRVVTLRAIRFLRPDVATVIADYDNSGAMTPAGAPVPPAKGFYDWIVVKMNGRWMIASWHESNLPPPPSPTPAQ